MNKALQRYRHRYYDYKFLHILNNYNEKKKNYDTHVYTLQRRDWLISLAAFNEFFSLSFAYPSGRDFT